MTATRISSQLKLCPTLPIMAYPSTYSAWHRSGLKGSKEHPLTIYRSDDETLPSTLNPTDVVIKIHAVSLNYREIAMLIGTYPVAIQDKGIPCSDAAAEVIATGSSVSRFSVGDRVCPNINIGKTYEGGADGMSVGVGTNSPGVLREYAVFDEQHLVKIPDHLSWEEVSAARVSGLRLLTGKGIDASLRGGHGVERA
jgi:NADPH:quinone reductase-like Zn-dependent oxidoreductase